MMETAAGAVAATGADAALHTRQQQEQPRAGDKAAAKGAAAESSGSPTKGDTIHTLCTSNGSPYLNFQNRIMCAMSAFCCPAAALCFRDVSGPASSGLPLFEAAPGNAVSCGI